MAQKTAKQIQDEANRLFGKGASDKKFEWRRQQQAAAGLELEKKKRGGVAGAYDRNKSLVQAAIPLLAGAFIPGGSMIAGAISGGLARGLDREGKGGIGLDLGQAAKGAVSGAMMGKLGGAARTGVQNFMANQAAKAIPALPANAPMIDTPMPGMAANVSAAPSAPLKALPGMGQGATTVGQRMAGTVMPSAGVGGMPVANAAPNLMQRLGAGAMEKAGQAGSYLAKRPEIAATALTTVSGARQAAANRRIQEQQLAQNQSQFEQEFGLRKGEQEREVERQRRIAEMLAPLFNRISGGQR